MISVREATPEDVAQMHQMINELAEYEKAPEEVIATERDLMKALFGRDFSSLSSTSTTAFLLQVRQIPLMGNPQFMHL